MKRAVALVTGAGSGIGKAPALGFAREGYKIGVLGHTQEEITSTVDEILAEGGKAIPLLAEISDEGQVAAVVKHLTQQYRRLNAVVANAGSTASGHQSTTSSFRNGTIRSPSNLTGTFLTIRATVPELKRTGGGSIVAVSPINGTRTFTTTGVTAHTATKAAQVAMLQQLALELARHHIRINAVCPGEIETNTNIEANTRLRKEHETVIPVVRHDGQVPITGGRPARSEDVADIIVFPASDRSRHITGSSIWVDGG